MTVKQQKFIVEYLKDFSAREAYIRAGYAIKYAAVNSHKILNLPEVQADIQKTTNIIKSNAIATLAECKEILTTALRDKTTRNADRIKIIERLAKMSGWDSATRTDVTSGGLPIVPTEIVFFTSESNSDS